VYKALFGDCEKPGSD